MTWFLLSILLFGSPPRAPERSPLQQQARRQVQHYIEAVHENKDAEINLWALAEVSRDKPEIRSYIASYAAKNNYRLPGLAALKDTTLTYHARLQQLTFTTQSPFLLVAYLLAEPDLDEKKRVARKFEQESGYPDETRVRYQPLVHALLQGGEITPRMLPVDRFQPLHFLLVFDNSLIRNHTISSDYLQSAEKNWRNNQSRRMGALHQSLYQLTRFRAYYLLDHYDKIDPLYETIINDTAFPLSKRKLTILRMLDYSMFRLGYYNRSINIIRRTSIPLAKSLNQEETTVKLKIALGLSLYYIGKIEESKSIYLKIQKEVANKDIDVSIARISNNLAIDYWKSGEFDRYLDLQFKALKEADNEHNYGLQSDILKNLFTHYRVNKDYTSAKLYLTRAAQLAKNQSDKQDLAQVKFYKGLLYRDQIKDYDRALSSFNSALKLISPTNYYDFYQNVLFKKSLLLEKKQNYKQAELIYEQIHSLANKRNDQRNVTYALFSKANVELKIGNLDSAQVTLSSIDLRQLDVLDFYQLAKAKTVQARYEQASGNPKKGSKILQPVIAQILKRSQGSGDLETGFWQVEPEYLDAFELYANLLINTGRPAKAVETLDRLKTINDAALYQNPLIRSKVLNEKELSDYKRFTEQLDELRKQVLAGIKDPQNKIQQQIDELSAQKNMLDRKINATATTEPVPVGEIQRKMDAHRRVLHITELNDTYYVAVISRTSVHINKIPITPALRARFKASIRRMREGTTNLKQLYGFTKLLGINKLPSYVSRLTIIPDSYLYQLPMDVLPVERPKSATGYGETRYLIERFETNYMTSLSDFHTSSPPAQFKYDFAGYGVSKFDEDRTALVPLPRAKAEIDSILQQLRALPLKKAFINDAATVQTFRQSAPRARILHMATHSKVNNQNPLFSSIYLQRPAGKSKKEFPGRIFAYQLFGLNLQNKLVMLNSCESGSGAYLQGTGVVGISRALRYAGAQSLVLNLWSVNDMLAADFATKFYSGINKGESKSEALQQAKLYFLKHKNANPHFWGSYMLLGNKSPVIAQSNWANRVAGISFMLFFFSMALASSVIVWRRRRKL